MACSAHRAQARLKREHLGAHDAAQGAMDVRVFVRVLCVCGVGNLDAGKRKEEDANRLHCELGLGAVLPLPGFHVSRNTHVTGPCGGTSAIGPSTHTCCCINRGPATRCDMACQSCAVIHAAEAGTHLHATDEESNTKT